MQPSTIVKLRNIRTGSLNQAFEALGVPHSELYPINYYRTRKGTSSERSTFKRRNPETDFIAWAEFLHKEQIKKWHPDLHPENQYFYTEKAKLLNAALARIRWLERKQKHFVRKKRKSKRRSYEL